MDKQPRMLTVALNKGEDFVYGLQSAIRKLVLFILKLWKGGCLLLIMGSGFTTTLRHGFKPYQFGFAYLQD